MFALPVDRLAGILPVLCMYLVMDREERERERGAPRTDKERCMKRPAKSSLLPESLGWAESRDRGGRQARFALATAASGLFSSGDLFRVFREDSDFSQAEPSEGVSCSDPESFSSSSSFLSFLLTLLRGHVSPLLHPASCDTEKKVGRLLHRGILFQLNVA